MGRKSALIGFHLERKRALSSSFTTEPVTVSTLDNIAFNVSVEGATTAAGAFFVEHRIRKSDHEVSPWARLTLDSAPILAGVDDVFLIYLNQVPPGQLRVGFASDEADGDALCDVWVSGCAVGA